MACRRLREEGRLLPVEESVTVRLRHPRCEQAQVPDHIDTSVITAYLRAPTNSWRSETQDREVAREISPSPPGRRVRQHRRRRVAHGRPRLRRPLQTYRTERPL